MRLRIAGFIVIVIVCWALAYGPLFAWSPVHPGYNSFRLRRAEILYPTGSTPDPALRQVDSYIGETESWLQMTMHKPITVVVCRNWPDFFRFVPMIRGRVGAVTLDTGTAIYVAPRVAEKHLDLAEFLRHELTHALVDQNVPIWRVYQMRPTSWLAEGVPVNVGRQKSYVTRAEFLARARDTNLLPVIDTTKESADMRFNYIAWSNFIDYLRQTRSHATFLRYFRTFLNDPAGQHRNFQQIYGKPLPDTIQEFQDAIRAGRYQPAAN